MNSQFSNSRQTNKASSQSSSSQIGSSSSSSTPAPLSFAAVAASSADKRQQQPKSTKHSSSSSNSSSKTPATRSSKQYCQERFACKGEKPEAHYYCSGCKSYQCALCEELIHEKTAKYIFHDRDQLASPNQATLCKSGFCKEANFGDIICKTCPANSAAPNSRGKLFCFQCDRVIHAQGSKRNHQRVPFESLEQLEHIQHLDLVPEPSTEGEDEEFISCQPFDIQGEKKFDEGRQLKEGPTEYQKEQSDDKEFISFDNYESLPHSEPTSNLKVDPPPLIDIQLNGNGGSSSGSDRDENSPRQNRTKAEKKKNRKGKKPPRDAPVIVNDQEKPAPLIQREEEINVKSKRKERGQGDDEEIPYQPSMPDLTQGIAQLDLDQRQTPTTTRKPRLPSESCEGGSFLLINEKEELQVSSRDDFARRLGCPPRSLVKVVSIFGNTGEGKSYTLNQCFFDGNEIFRTSPAQSCCTVGVWAAYDPKTKIIAIDTEGLLGVSENNNRRTRLLLKVLAISDIIIYRTRAERLHNDLFTFLGDASSAYVRHFNKELKAAAQRLNLSCTLADLGPVVMVFHETLHTEVLKKNGEQTPEGMLRQRFQQMGITTEAFSAIEYIGTQTSAQSTSFRELQQAIKRHLNNSAVRSPRTPTVVFNALKLLNDKFRGEINPEVFCPFPDEYFTCSERCLSCNARCVNSMNHELDGIGHACDPKVKCKYQQQYDNQLFYCRRCYQNGDEILCIPKALGTQDSLLVGSLKWLSSGYVLECKKCGEIYRSRQYWYGNKEPWEEAVRTEIRHCWRGEPTNLGSQYLARKVVDSISGVGSNLQSYIPPYKIGDKISDWVNPSYWVPNHRIHECGICKKEFGDDDQKHHCRACGGGFCDSCSSKTRPVPERNWGDTPVRVCDRCFEQRDMSGHSTPPSEVTVRIVAEKVDEFVEMVGGAFEYPKGFIKEYVRPEYWVPDDQIKDCACCKSAFDVKLPIHHCRACGQGVCDRCSQTRMPVPSRNWHQAVRVCDECKKKPNL